MILTLFRLYYEFFKIGLFAIGGGAATIPFLSVLSRTTGWFTQTDLANMIAISESTPGAIGVNMASYVGFVTCKSFGNAILGCIVSSIGLVTPSVIITIIISGILTKFKDSSLVKNTFYGLRPASAGLIAAAAFEVMKIALINISEFMETWNIFNLFNFKNIILFVLLFIAIKRIKLHPILYIAISALIGIIFKL